MPEQPFDSRVGVWEHIHAVRVNLDQVVRDLLTRALAHDQSKLVSPEREALDVIVPAISPTEYGSAEWEGFRQRWGATLEHHYARNRHHPEHFEHGVDDMTLMDLVEMLCDWKAAVSRSIDGDLRQSLEVNLTRFGIEPQLTDILSNTIAALGW